MSEVPHRARPWMVQLVTTLVAWAAAFVIVLALLVVFGHSLEALPYALNALVFTGVLVPVMGNIVMPVVSVAVARRLPGPVAQTPSPHTEDRSDSEWPHRSSPERVG